MSDVVTGGTSQAGTPYQSTPAVTTVLGRDEFGNPTAIRGPNGYELSYLYDSITHAHVVSTTDVHGYVSTSSPNYLFGVPDAVTDINGHTVSYDFDQWGRLESVTGPMDQGTSVPTIVYQYALPLAAGQSSFAAAPLWDKTGHKDIFRNPASSTAANHDFVETVSFMDGHGRIIKTRKDLERDVDGLLEVGMTESGHITFDNLGRPWKVAQPRFYSGPPTAFSTGPLNYQTVTTYDALDRVLSVTTPHDSPDGSVTSVTTTTRYTLEEDVDGALRMASVVTDPNGYAKTVLRDVDGSIVEVREVNDLPGATNETLVTSYDYNPVDELIQVTDAGGNVTTSTYDTLGRMVALNSPDMGLTKWSYDLAGSVVAKETAQLRAKGQKVTYEYDIDQLIAIHYPDSEDKLFQYGQPSEAGDGFGNVAGRIKSESAEAGLRTLEYDRLGNVSRTNMQFHRIREPHFGDYIASVEYEYGPFGRLHKVRFPSVTNFVNGGQHTMSANAESVTYAYDAGGNLQSVFGQNTEVNPQHPGEMPHTDYVVHIGYDHFGQEVRHIAGNFAETIYEYQPGTRRLASISTDFRDDFMRQAGQPARAMQRVSYQYDLVGNITHVENQVPWANQPSGTVRVGTTVQDFTYDKLYQLRAATGRTQSNDDWRYRYFLEQEYDELGNITKKDQSSYREIKDNGIFRDDYEIREQSYVSTYYYDGPQPHTPSLIEERLPAESIDFPRAFTYDASGNQTKSVYRGSDTREIVWNEDDQIKKVIKNGQELNKTLYDAEGNKAVHLHHVSGLEETAYLGPNMTLRDGKYLTKHIYTGDQRVATKMDADWMQEPPTLYFHNDHLGSTNYSTNDNQTLTQHDEYFPTGELWRGETDNRYDLARRYLFTGKELDIATGLYDFGARSYDARQGQWLSPDPAIVRFMTPGVLSGSAQPINFDLYNYVGNNPVNHVDPDGRQYHPWAGTPADIANQTCNMQGGCTEQEYRELVRHHAEVQAQAIGNIRLSAGAAAGVRAAAKSSWFRRAVASVGRLFQKLLRRSKGGDPAVDQGAHIIDDAARAAEDVATKGAGGFGRTLSRLAGKDAEIFAEASKAAASKGGSFLDDLGALSQTVGSKIPGGQVHKIGTLNGQPVFGSLVSRTGIVSMPNGTQVVKAPLEGAIEILGPFR